MISVTSNKAEYRDALIEWMAYFRTNARQAIRYQGRLLGERLVSLTPPRTQSQGKKRVSADIKRVILGIEDLPPRDQAHLVEKGSDVVRVFVTKDGTVYGTDSRLYRPEATLDEISKYHQSQRLKSGRVTSAGSRTQNIGRWKFLDKLVVKKDVLDEYIRMVWDRVGRAKGGWANGTIKLGGTVSQWIAVHARTDGEFTDGTEGFSPYVLFVNKSEWASGGDTEQHVMENAINSRIRDIHKSIINAAKGKGVPFKL